jgi:ADP-heptose:LPS heptosyltransferase
MKVSTMRRMDYWIGVPLCFLLTVISCLLKLFTAKKKKTNGAPRKILFIKLSEMGSIILAYPLMNKIRDKYKDAELFFLTFEKNKGIFDILSIAPGKNIFTIREESFYLFVPDTLDALRKIRKEKIDIVFDLELFSRFTAIFSYLSGANKRIGFYRYNFEGLYRGDLLTHKIQYNPLIHISRLFLSLSDAIELPVKSTPELENYVEDEDVTVQSRAGLNLPYSELLLYPKDSAEKMRVRLKEFGVAERSRLFLINPGDSILPLREWPLENFITLGKMILESDSGNYIIIAGKGGCSDKAEKLCMAIGRERCVNLNNKTSLMELLALFTISEVLIANDCGLAHLASLTPIKKFVIFGPESPALYRPLGENVWIFYSNLPCSPCFSAFNHRRSSCADNKCLKAVRPEEVYELIQSIGGFKTQQKG